MAKINRINHELYLNLGASLMAMAAISNSCSGGTSSVVGLISTASNYMPQCAVGIRHQIAH